VRLAPRDLQGHKATEENQENQEKSGKGSVTFPYIFRFIYYIYINYMCILNYSHDRLNTLSILSITLSELILCMIA